MNRWWQEAIVSFLIGATVAVAVLGWALWFSK